MHHSLTFSASQDDNRGRSIGLPRDLHGLGSDLGSRSDWSARGWAQDYVTGSPCLFTITLGTPERQSLGFVLGPRKIVLDHYLWIWIATKNMWTDNFRNNTVNFITVVSFYRSREHLYPMHLSIVYPTLHTWGGCRRKQGDFPSEFFPRGWYLVRIVPIHSSCMHILFR